MKFSILFLFVLIAANAFSQLASGDLSELRKEEVLISSLRSGDNDIFIVNPITGDAKNITQIMLLMKDTRHGLQMVKR